MQVLVLAVQNAVDYANLGARRERDAVPLDGRDGRRAPLRRDLRQPSSRRTLASHLDVEAVAQPPRARQPGPDRAPAGGDPRSVSRGLRGALQPVFLIAAGLAVAAFVATWFLQERPLRQTVADQGIGDSFASPRDATSLDELEARLSRSPARENRHRVYERLAGVAGSTSRPGSVAAAALRRRRFAHAGERLYGSPGRPGR